MVSSKLSSYTKLLSTSYTQAVESLLSKYGAAEFSFVINEESYTKFLNKEIKNFVKNPNISRSSEGLYCHHIAEDKYYNLSDKDAVLAQQLPFSTQDKTALVYCDLIEHAILHKLIKSEGGNSKSSPDKLIHNIKEWYIDENHPHPTIPQQKYLVNCYDKAYLDKVDAQTIYDALK